MKAIYFSVSVATPSSPNSVYESYPTDDSLGGIFSRLMMATFQKTKQGPNVKVEVKVHSHNAHIRGCGNPPAEYGSIYSVYKIRKGKYSEKAQETLSQKYSRYIGLYLRNHVLCPMYMCVIRNIKA